MGYPTKYGVIGPLGIHSQYMNGNLKDCVLEDKIEIMTEYGTLTPQYDFSSFRKKLVSSMSFYEDGTLRRISLNNPTKVKTPIGIREAELLTFYECGAIKRLFPLNGHLSAYWEEEDEYELAKEDSFDLPCGKITTKVISVYFYKDGGIKSLTFWPREIISVLTPIGGVQVRIGVSFYQDGRIHSLEPASPTFIKTPIGIIQAFDENANGILGDNNSLILSKDGTLCSLITSTQRIIVKNLESKAQTIYSPSQELEEDGEEIWFRPLKIEFEKGSVRLNDGERIDISQHQFMIQPYHKIGFSPCSNCASCGGCSMEGKIEAS